MVFSRCETDGWLKSGPLFQNVLLLTGWLLLLVRQGRHALTIAKEKCCVLFELQTHHLHCLPRFIKWRQSLSPVNIFIVPRQIVAPISQFKKAVHYLKNLKSLY